MSRSAIVALASALAAGLGLAALFLAAPREGQGDAASVVLRPSFTGYDGDGALAWTLSAARGTLDGEAGRFEEVEIVFHASDGSPLTAHGASFTFDGEEGTLSGGVEIERGDDYRLEAASLTFRESAAEVRAGPVTILSQAGRVEASSLTYDLKTGHSSVDGGFEADVSRTALRVHGDRAEEADGLLSLSGSLEIERAGESWQADRITVAEEDETVTLLGRVQGTLPEGTIAAEALSLSPDGAAAARGVHLILTRVFFVQDHDS